MTVTALGATRSRGSRHNAPEAPIRERLARYRVLHHRGERSRPWVVRRGPRGLIVARFARRAQADEYLAGWKLLVLRATRL